MKQLRERCLSYGTPIISNVHCGITFWYVPWCRKTDASSVFSVFTVMYFMTSFRLYIIDGPDGTFYTSFLTTRLLSWSNESYSAGELALFCILSQFIKGINLVSQNFSLNKVFFLFLGCKIFNTFFYLCLLPRRLGLF